MTHNAQHAVGTYSKCVAMVRMLLLLLKGYSLFLCNPPNTCPAFTVQHRAALPKTGQGHFRPVVFKAGAPQDGEEKVRRRFVCVFFSFLMVEKKVCVCGGVGVGVGVVKTRNINFTVFAIFKCTLWEC